MNVLLRIHIVKKTARALTRLADTSAFVTQILLEMEERVDVS